MWERQKTKTNLPQKAYQQNKLKFAVEHTAEV